MLDPYVTHDRRRMTDNVTGNVVHDMHARGMPGARDMHGMSPDMLPDWFGRSLSTSCASCTSGP